MLHISLENMVAIITGAAAGIGRAIALKMASEYTLAFVWKACEGLGHVLVVRT
jgi:NAD(P)-dependent dehydrogenase (short-subunit alcohol dehydrogenase family)